MATLVKRGSPKAEGAQKAEKLRSADALARAVGLARADALSAAVARVWADSQGRAGAAVITATIDAVNALSDAQVAGNLANCAPLVNAVPFALQSGSACIDAGSTTGAPAWDYELEARDARPDIGPTEFP